jgi:HEAT repeat protein
MMAVVEISPVTADDIPTLVADLQAEEGPDRVLALIRLVHVGLEVATEQLEPGAGKETLDITASIETAVPTLTKLLEDKRVMVRVLATLGLAVAGSAGKGVIEEVLAMLDDEDLAVRRAAVVAVGEILAVE